MSHVVLVIGLVARGVADTVLRRAAFPGETQLAPDRADGRRSGRLIGAGEGVVRP